ncbi:MAG: hypothetical protein JKY94_16810 [Rhodobacteraceae bacterium]|nr:hypothetical protein [Paracoccaceae bacterium]
MPSRTFFSDPNSHFDAVLANAAQAAYAAASTLTNNSAGFDRTAQNTTSGKHYSGAILGGQTGAVTGAPTSFTCTYQLQDSPDNSAWTNFGTALVLTAASDADSKSIDLSQADRWVRVVLTVAYVAGTTPTLFATSNLHLVHDKSR